MEQEDTSGPDIFLSYASKDRERVIPLANALQNEGWSVWWDRKIPVGRTYDEVIKAALTDSKCVVVVWSEESVESRFVKTEASISLQRNKLVPVLIDNVEPPLEFYMIQGANLVDWHPGVDNEEFGQLVVAIGVLAGKTKATKAPEEKLQPKNTDADRGAGEDKLSREDEGEKAGKAKSSGVVVTDTQDRRDRHETWPGRRRAIQGLGIVVLATALILVGVWSWPRLFDLESDKLNRPNNKQIITPAKDTTVQLAIASKGNEGGKDIYTDTSTDTDEESVVAVDAQQNLSRGFRLLNQAAEALGGLQKLKSIVSVKITGTVTVITMQQDLSFSAFRLAVPPDRFRSETPMFGRTMLEIRNGAEGWKTDPRTGGIVAMPAEDIARDDSSVARDIYNILSHVDDPYYRAMYVDSGTLGDDPVQWVVLLGLDGDTICQVGVGTKQHLPIGRKYWFKGPTGEGVVVETMSSWVRRVGVLVPMKVEITKDGKTVVLAEWSEYIINGEVPPDAFDNPSILSQGAGSPLGPPKGSETPKNLIGGAVGIENGERDYFPTPDEFVPMEISPELIHEKTPEYPHLAEQAGITGIVWVQALVGKDGTVKDALVAKTSGTVSLDEAAVKVAHEYRYKPGIQNGRPVACWVSYKVEFTLDR